ncbi:MAG TPA: hypothetical protein VN643_27835 [Pyrinomonadaceae bacterium]|nr:hypothetical protein [Pyrinomonadaceae bacterium]
MNAHHTLNPFLAVKDADGLIQSYVAVLGAELTRRLPATGRPVVHAEVKIGDATIGLSEKLPAGNYVWMITPDVNYLKTRIDGSGSAWKITSPPTETTDGESIIMHATDLSGATWIFQQVLASG